MIKSLIIFSHGKKEIEIQDQTPIKLYGASYLMVENVDPGVTH
jgi:hypothetical protein